MSECESCRKPLAKEDDDALADKLEAAHQACACEIHSVGEGSPGPVGNAELLHRLIVSPRDYDPHRGILLEAPFQKAYKNGLSVFRDCASNDDLTDIATEALTHRKGDPKRKIEAVYLAKADAIRSLQQNGQQLFCIYDQTVSRRDASKNPVPTHAGIFQRPPPSGTKDRRRLLKDGAGKLREKFIAGEVDLGSYRGGLALILNAKVAAGDFEETATIASKS